jgi:transcriptional regulator
MLFLTLALCTPRAEPISWPSHLDNQDAGTILRHSLYLLERPMDTTKRDVIQGTLDMLILKTLSLAPMHGYGITQRIEQVSQGVFKVNPGSLLTALRRLERRGWLSSEWRQTDNSRRAKYYALTREGNKQLAVEAAEWRRRSRAVGKLLAAEG